MTDQRDAPRSPPTARELLESVDALMRRNRRTGTATSPLPPPEGRIIPAAFDDETQALSAEIEAELEAERIRETLLAEGVEPLATVPPSAADIPESLPIEAVAEEETIPDAAVRETPERVAEAFTEAGVVEDKAKGSEEPGVDSPGEREAAAEAKTQEKDDLSLAGWLREMLPAKSLALVDRILPHRADPAVPSPAGAAAETVQTADMPEIPEVPEAVAGVHVDAVVTGDEAGEEAAARAGTLLEDTNARLEDDLLLWEFVPQPHAMKAAETVSGPAFPETEKTKAPEEAPLALTPSFSEVVSFLSAPEVLASPSQNSVSYATPTSTVALDDFPAEEERAVTEFVPGVFPEVSREENVALAGTIAWRPAEEADETPSAIDAGMAMDVTEALATLSGTKAMNVTGEEEEAAAVEESGLWRLVEPETLQGIMPISMPELETEETEAEFVEEAAFPEAVPASGAHQKAEETVFAMVLPGSVLNDADDLETGDGKMVLPPVAEDWQDGAGMDDDPFFSLATEAPVSNEPEVMLEAFPLPEDSIPVLPVEDIVVIAGEEETPVEAAVASGTPVYRSGVVRQGAEAPPPVEDLAMIEDKTFVAEPVFRFESEPDEVVPKKAEAFFPPSTATLLSEQQRREYEAKVPSIRFSAAQLLTEYQRRQNPQTQNAKTAAASSQPVRAEPLSAASLTLVTDDALPTVGEIARVPPKEAEMARAPSVPARKETALELTLEPLSHDAWSGRPIAPAAPVSPEPKNVLLDEEGYYPVLTDIVDGDEFSVSSRA